MGGMISQFFIDRPRFAFVLVILMSLCGGIALFDLPVAEYPELAPATIRVSASYPGASAQVVADSIAIPVEDQINGVENLLYYSSSCDNNGSYSCSVTFKSGADTDMALVNLQNAVKRAERKLPSTVKQQGISVQKRNSDMLALWAFTTDGTKQSLQQLGDYVEKNIKEAVMRLDGVSVAEVMASREYAMRIWLDPVRMASLNLSITDVSSAIEKQNVQAAAGTVGSEYASRYLSYKLNAEGRLKSADEFAAIVVRSDPATGGQVLLGDVARIELGSKSYSGKSLMNGKEAIVLSVYKTPEANALAVVKRVKAELAEWDKRLPAGVAMETVHDATAFTLVFMKAIVSTLFMALGLVVLITWLFLQDWRATIVPAAAIPVSLLATFIFVWAFGYTINILTMFGLILVIGSLVDDAIVVVENTQTLMATEGLSAKEAAKKSMRQITSAVIATTLVTVACYIPLVFYGGMVGKMYIQFAFTMCVALSLSTCVALTLSPVLCSLLLRKPGKPSRLFAPVNIAIDGSRKAYLAVAGLLVRRGIVTALLFAAACVGVWFAKDMVKETLLPDEDKGNITIDIELAQGATLKRTNQVLEDIQARIKDIPGIASIMLMSGSGAMSGSGENCGQGMVALDHWDMRRTPDKSVKAIIAEIMRRTADVHAARIRCFTSPPIMGLGRVGGVGFNLCSDAGADSKQLAAAADAFARQVSALPEAATVMNTFRADTPQLRLTLDRRKAEILGVSPSAFFAMLQNKLASVYVNDFTLGGSAYEVIVQSAGSYRASVEDVSDLHVTTASGASVPLSAIANITYEVGPKQVTRFDKMPSASLNARSRRAHAHKGHREAYAPRGIPHRVERDEPPGEGERGPPRIPDGHGRALRLPLPGGPVRELDRAAVRDVLHPLRPRRRVRGAVGHRHADEHLRSARHGDADRPLGKERDPHGRVRQAAARCWPLRDGRRDEGRRPPLPRRADDGMELPLRRLAARPRLWRRRGLAEGDRHLHLLGNARRHVRGHLLHSRPLRHLPAPPRADPPPSRRRLLTGTAAILAAT